MKKKRLALDEFKIHAKKIDTANILERVSGGATTACHCEDKGDYIDCS